MTGSRAFLFLEASGVIMRFPGSGWIPPIVLWIAAGFLLCSSPLALCADSGTLYISVESVQSQTKRKQETLLIDVRDKAAFDRFRIQGSIHIPLYALKAKTFHKEKALVLVSEGYPDLELERTCNALRGAGFTKTSILSGGLRCWLMKKGPVEGDPFAAQEVSRVPPKHFFAQKDFPEWLVVTVFGATAGPSPQMIPEAVALTWERNPREFVSALKTLINSKPGSPQRSVLVCDERGEKYEGIERAVQQEAIRNVFYLKGGLEAYRGFLQQQALLAQPGKEEVKRCVNCP
jgi:rhodanese-related sulfurtransferase